MRQHAASRLFAALLAVILLSGCSVFEAKEQLRGNRIDPDELAELKPGVSTRADASSLLGSPTAKATFDDNTWIYISEVTRPRIGRIQGELSQTVVTLTFNDAGVLQGVKKLTQNDALPVAVVSRATPSPGSDASIMQQLFGGIGRYAGASSSSSSTENSNTQ